MKKRRDTRCILVDSREKRPWTFSSQKVIALKHGDYSILGGKGRIVIERKSLTDLFVTFSRDRWEKFYAKMDRATDALDCVFLFIESSIAEVYRGIPHSRIPTNYMLNRLLDLTKLGVQIIFTGNSKKGPEFAEYVLRNY